MTFRKYAKVESIASATLTADGQSLTAVATPAAPTTFLGAGYQLPIDDVLAKHAEKYAISRNPADYIYEVVRACTTDVPNENGDAFRRGELLHFNTRVGMPVYLTFKSKPHHVHHKADNPRDAKGIILDAHYHDDTPALEVCPSCGTRTAERESRDRTGMLCRCGQVVKDEFVEILIAIDTKKDPHLARGITAGELRATSMGCDCSETVCNVCSHVARSASQFCRHIKGSAKRTFWMRTSATEGSDEGEFKKVSAAEAERLLASRGCKFQPTGFRTIKVADLEIRRAIEDCYGVEFQEQSRVGHPADPKALQRAILRAQAAVARGDVPEAAATGAVNRRRAALTRTAQAGAAPGAEPHRWIVIRVDGDPKDTHAAETIEQAIDLAMPDEGSVVEMGEVEAADGGAARLMDPAGGWHIVDPKDFGYDYHGFEPDADVELKVPNDARVEVLPPGGAAPGAPGMPPPPPGAAPAPPNPQPPAASPAVTPEEMGIMPPPAFGRTYSAIYADVFPDRRVVVGDLDVGQLFTFTASKPVATRDDRYAYAAEIVDSIQEQGFVAALKGLAPMATKRIAQIADHDALTDREPERDLPAVTMAGDPIIDRTPGPKLESDPSISEGAETDREPERMVPDDSLVAKPIMDREDAPGGTGGSVGGDTAETDRGDRPGANIKSDDMISDPMLDRAAATERRLKAIYARREAALVAKHQAELEAHEASLQTRFARALRLAWVRRAKNLEENAPLKASIFDVLTSPREVGQDARTAEALVYQPMESDLAAHLIEAAWADASAEEIESLLARSAELMAYEDSYFASAESDLAKHAVYMPSITAASELEHRSAEAEFARREALRGNLGVNSFNPEPTADDSGTWNDLREVIRGMNGRPQHSTNRHGSN